MGKTPFISAIITNYNGLTLGLLEDCLDHFLNFPYSNLEIIFVDNASTDKSVELVKKKFGHFKNLTIIANPVNVMSKGINLALDRAKGEYTLFLNNDIFLDKNFLTELLKVMEDKKVGLVQGKLVSYFDHQKIDSVGETIDVYGNPVTIGAGEKDRGQHDKRIETLSVTGAASIFRRSLIKEVGKLDPLYGIGYEDMDLALRVRLAGYKVIYTPKAIAFHKRASSVGQVSQKVRAKVKWDFNKNRLATMIKNYELKTLLRTLPVALFLYLFAFFWEFFVKKQRHFAITRLTSVFWIVSNLGSLLQKRKFVQIEVRKVPDREILGFFAKKSLFKEFLVFAKSKSW